MASIIDTLNHDVSVAKVQSTTEKSISCWQNTDNIFCVCRISVSKKRVCFPDPFFDVFLFSTKERKSRQISAFSPSMRGENTENPGCGRCRGSADESAHPVHLPQEGSDDSPPRDSTGIFHLVFHRTASHAVPPGMPRETLRSHHR